MRRVAILVAVVMLVAGSCAPAVADQAPAPRQPLGVDVRRDLTYRRVGGENLKLDAYVPAGGGLRPGVITLYGGGWVIGSKELSGAAAVALATQGFVAFAIDYRLAPQHPFPAAVEDAQASVEWVRQHAHEFGVDPARIGAIGGSAGGHLAAMLATLGNGPHDRDARIAAAVSLSGPMDLHPGQYPPESQQYIDAFLDCHSGPCDEGTIVAASPISHVSPGDAPMLLASGEEDVLVPPTQAVRMSAALDGAGVPHELLLVPNAGHDARIGLPTVQPSFEFLRRELGDVEPGSPGGIGTGGDGDGGLLAPAIVIVVAALVVGAILLVVARRRRRVRR